MRYEKVTRHPLEMEEKPYVTVHYLYQVDTSDCIGTYDHDRIGIKKGTCLDAGTSSPNTNAIIASGESVIKWWVGPTSV